MTTQIRVTRRSIVGFGYTSTVENDERGNLRVCRTESPTHTGTPRQVIEAVQDDRILASYRGGTYYTTQWFVRVEGAWRKVSDEQYQNIGMLFDRDIFGNLQKDILLEVE